MGLRVGTIAEKPLNYVQRTLEQKIRDRSANLGVIGLGYVGLPLATEMAQRGFRLLASTSMEVRLNPLTLGYPMS